MGIHALAPKIIIHYGFQKQFILALSLFYLEFCIEVNWGGLSIMVIEALVKFDTRQFTSMLNFD